eukprot:GHVP01025009.1.p1 GENE.GHVP01025009.1~~GHVP01025009.1.p1  ORF type:complete len:509 (+),score=58.19 GHVP01025009.1:862-2388(+)
MLQEKTNYQVNLYFFYVILVILMCSTLTGYHYTMDAMTVILKGESKGEGGLFGFNCGFKISDKYWGLLTAVHTMGSLLAIISLFKVISKYGRRFMLFLATLFTFIGSLIMALSGSVFIFGIGRFLCGFASGIVSLIVPSYMIEVTPTPLQTKIGTLYPFGSTFGTIGAQIAGILFGTETRWRNFFYVTVVFSCVYGVLLFLCPESPVFCEENGHFVKAREIRKALYREKTDQVKKTNPLTFKSKKASLSTNPFLMSGSRTNLEENDESSGSSDEESDIEDPKETELRSIVGEAKEEKLKKRGFMAAFRDGKNTKGIMIGTAIHIGYQLSGTSALFCFSQSIFGKAFNNIAKYKKWGIIMTVIYPVGLLIYSLTGHFFRKKTFLAASFFFVSIWLLLISIFIVKGFETGAYVSAVGLSFAYGTGFASIPWMIASELFEKNDVFLLSLYFSFINITFSLLVILITPMVLTNSHFVFGVFFIFAVLSGVAVLLFYKRKFGEIIKISHEDTL